MRTKVLCAATLAAGALTSMAQVYSANIVGYVNATTPVQYSFQSAPLQNMSAVTNGLNEVISNTGNRDGDQVLLWNGTTWTIYVLNSADPYGVEDINGTILAAPIMTKGLGFVYNNQQGAAGTITYVGQVATGTNSLPLPFNGGGFQAVGSTLPVSGGLTSALQMTNNGSYDGSIVEFLITDAAGNEKGFSAAVFNSADPTGFEDLNGTVIPEPQIPLAGGFFFSNQGGTPLNWQQILNP